jgi:acyl-CoA dehydrogenase
VADRAIQVFGAMGVSPDTPLANIYTSGRTLRFADGPDEVHLRVIARAELGEGGDRRKSVSELLAQAVAGQTNREAVSPRVDRAAST